jgi:hypothetical protein
VLLRVQGHEQGEQVEKEPLLVVLVVLQAEKELLQGVG